jgi:alpha-L-fucosidase
VEAWQNQSWQKIGEGTTIGYKRIVKVDPVETEKIRVNITASKASPVISNIEIY